MDVSNFFWDFIDYELNLKNKVTTLEQQIFNHMNMGDLIMNQNHLNNDEPIEYFYYDRLCELISMAARICEGEKLKKIHKFIDLHFEDQEMVEVFNIEI